MVYIVLLWRKKLKKILEACKKIYYNEKPLIVEWTIAGLIALMMILMFNYIDFKSLTIWSTNILDCIARGDITQYYEYTALNEYGLVHQYISGTLYSLIIWSIWNIPIWAIQFFTENAIIENAALLIWSKLFLVLSLGITLFITYKICKEIFKDKNKNLWIVFLAATFIFTYIGVFYAGQNDIMICMFATLGIYYLIKEKNIWFYLFTSLAISVKYFFLIPYIPLILLIEKNIFKIIIKIGIGVLPIIIFKLLVSNFPMYGVTENTGYSDIILGGFLNSGFTVANGYHLSLFILFFIVICFIAYMTKPKTKQIKNNYIFYFITATLLIMFMFSTWYEFYRPILLMPFLMILYGFKPKLFRINVILDTIMSVVFLALTSVQAESLFNTTYSMKESAIIQIFNIQQSETISLQQFLLENLGNNLNIITSIITTILFAAMGIILVINYPKFNLEDKESIEEKPERWIIWLRTLVVIPALMFLIIKIF